MEKTPKSMRLQIGIFGRRNVGKSSLINIITHQQTSVVSDVAGTTTDAVEKAMEMLPVGPVLFIDTAGIDDEGELGKLRIEKSEKIIERADVAIIVCDYQGWSDFEINLAKHFKEKKIPLIAVVNKSDIKEVSCDEYEKIREFSDYCIQVSAALDKDIPVKIREALIRCVPDEYLNSPSILENIVREEDTVILVTPIDKEAPKGRLIMPQVNVLRELLDSSCIAVVTTEKTLKKSINTLKEKAKLVITDSQAFKQVSETVTEDTALTSFSILFARLKGDLQEFVKGAKTVSKLKDGDKVLICESCTHHAIEDDIGTVKIPNLIRKKSGKNVYFERVSSHEFPKNIKEYALIVHCGGCMTNRREILSRIEKAKAENIPITNYGIIIAYCLDILERAIKPLEL